MEKGKSLGMMEEDMKEIFWKINFMDMDFTLIEMGNNLREHFKTGLNMERELLLLMKMEC